jgi:hypothetical protein
MNVEIVLARYIVGRKFAEVNFIKAVEKKLINETGHPDVEAL